MQYICILVFFVFFAGVAMTVGEGLWNNAINLIAIVLSSMMAAVAGPALGALMLDKFGKEIDSMWYFAFAGTWLVFFLAVNVFRVLLEQISKTRMRFVPPLELVAGPLVGLVAAVMFTSFMAFTLYTMPVRAGEWKLPDSGWQRSTMKTGSGPFYTVLKATLGAEADELFAK